MIYDSKHARGLHDSDVHGVSVGEGFLYEFGPSQFGVCIDAFCLTTSKARIIGESDSSGNKGQPQVVGQTAVLQILTKCRFVKESIRLLVIIAEVDINQ